jgi:hypothetical protein
LKKGGVIFELIRTRKNKPVEEEEPNFEGYPQREIFVLISTIPAGSGLRSAAVESRFELCRFEAHPDRGTTGYE